MKQERLEGYFYFHKPQMQWRHIFSFEAYENILWLKYGKQPTAHSNIGACSPEYSE